MFSRKVSYFVLRLICLPSYRILPISLNVLVEKPSSEMGPSTFVSGLTCRRRGVSRLGRRTRFCNLGVYINPYFIFSFFKIFFSNLLIVSADLYQRGKVASICYKNMRTALGFVRFIISFHASYIW